MVVFHLVQIFFFFVKKDGTYRQKLVTPVNASAENSGQKRTVQDLLNEFSTPVRKAGKPRILFSFLEDFFLSFSCV